MASPLYDLDELILRCRDEKAKKYIKEAVSCYKVGAFRSSIVSAWVAVSFDIIDKLKELSLAGDKEAEGQLNDFEKARQAGDIAKSLKFERDILSVARDKLELISHVEYIDLERLQQDRNRCAHPSMTSDDDIFNPSAELARLHIRSAVEHLLQYPPSQGKYALESLLSEIDSQYFPTKEENALTALKNSPLYKARKSLVRNFIIVLIKKILTEPLGVKQKIKVIAALKATSTMYRQVFNEVVSEKLSSIVKLVDDNNIDRTFIFLKRLPDTWECLDPDVKQKIQAYVENLPEEKLEDVDFLLEHQGLSAHARKRVKYATRKELADAVYFDVPKEVADRMVKLYVSSDSFDDANSFAPVINIHASDFNKEQVENIVRACGDNFQIRNSFEKGAVINSLRKNKNFSDEEYNQLLIDSGLKEYAKSEADQEDF